MDGAVNLEVSLNGQDFGATGFAFSRYKSPPRGAALLQLRPLAGPTAGGTLLRITPPDGLAGGSEYRCRFGDEAEAPASADGAPEPSASGESVSDAKGDAKGEKAAGETEASEAKTPSEEADGKKADGGEDQATTADAAETEAAKDVEAAIELLPPEMRELGHVHMKRGSYARPHIP